RMDQALLMVRSEVPALGLRLAARSAACHQCLYQFLASIPPSNENSDKPGTVSVMVDTQHPLTLLLNSSDSDRDLCKIQFHFGEFGNYSLVVKTLSTSTTTVSCDLVINEGPINSYLPILFAFLVYMGILAVLIAGHLLMKIDPVRNWVYKKLNPRETDRLINSELGSPHTADSVSSDPTPPLWSSASRQRLRSLDTFRGLSLIIMVFVNYGGGKYWFFRHESWNGRVQLRRHPSALFSRFVFIMGTSVSLSLSSMLKWGSSKRKVLGKILWRSFLLILLGIIVVNPNYCLGPLSWDNLRIPGVLQRLGFTYLVVAALELLFTRSGAESGILETPWPALQDILPYWPQWIFILMLEVIWLCLTFLLPVPGCPRGYLGPGGIGDFGNYPNCTGGAAGYIDRLLLGENHIYQHPSSSVIYQTTMPYDPEGILGTINTIFLAFLGLQAGKIILFFKDQHKQIMSRFIVWSTVMGIVSAILTKCSKEEGFIPINKNLWSLSYVTTTSCFAFILLLLLYYLVDVKRVWSGAPFFYPGMNSILVYIGHEVFENYFPFKWKMRDSQSHAEHLTQNLTAMTLWVLISYVLYRKRIFWKI
ncbi:HGNAT acetyltransferase, partial [Thinocorus orbignyianus]|nr:HGNAT acetyltransferase [Thinocorus orbignyianus]